MVEKEEELKKVLKDLEKIRGITGSVIVRRNGLLVASGLSKEADSNSIAARSAAIIGASEGSVKELDLGKFSQVIVNASRGRCVYLGAGPEALIVFLLEKGANLGSILPKVEKAAKKVKRLIG